VFFVLPETNVSFSVVRYSVFRGILFQKDYSCDGGSTECHISRVTDRTGEEPCVDERYVFHTAAEAENFADKLAHEVH